MSWLRLDRTWAVTETAEYPDAPPTFRIVEDKLTRRQASRSVPQWQAASNRNRALVAAVVPADKRGPLPTITYRAEQLTSSSAPPR